VNNYDIILKFLKLCIGKPIIAKDVKPVVTSTSSFMLNQSCAHSYLKVPYSQMYFAVYERTIQY